MKVKQGQIMSKTSPNMRNVKYPNENQTRSNKSERSKDVQEGKEGHLKSNKIKMSKTSPNIRKVKYPNEGQTISNKVSKFK
jgi:hypothetical protein